MTTKLIDFIFEKEFTSDEILTQDKYMSVCNKYPELMEYAKIDCLYQTCPEWRGIDYRNYKITKPVTVFAHSDYSLTNTLLDKYNQPFIKYIFSTNADCYDTNVEGIPHGLGEDCNDTETHPITGNKMILYDVLKNNKEYKYTCYMNFRVKTNYNVRAQTWNQLVEKPFIYKKVTEDVNINLRDRKQFLQDIYDSAFSICPRGNGIDTVRLWESLYCRTIPIVKRETAMRYFEDLPILWIDNWNDIESQFWLRKQFERIMDSQWNLDKLRIGYWEQRFLNAVNK
jgi:hypothetical protein